jgi:hypothetical protein
MKSTLLAPLIDSALGEDPLGVLCFAPGYFAAQFMKGDRIGSKISRHISIKEGVLVIQLSTKAADGTPVARILKFSGLL